MPTQETNTLDKIIASRRSLLVGGGAALAALAMPQAASAVNTVSSFTDNDILNFALNLEYLEANFYYLAAFGTTIDVANSASTAAGASVQGIAGVAGNGGVAAGVVANTSSLITTGTFTPASLKVPFTSPLIAAYAVETAIEEGKHVAFLRSALGALAVAQPALNLTPPLFLAVATAASVPTSYNFNPYANDAFFLLGAYIFEDVGVSAYHGAAPLITNKTTILPAAAGILAVEAYHAGLVRTSINANDAGTGISAGFPAGTLTTVTNLISAFRNTAAQALASTNAGNPEDGSPDDYGLATQTVVLPTGTVPATRIVNADPTKVTAWARSTAQVLNIVTGGGAVNAGTAKGGFFPAGLNGLFS